MKKIMKVVGIIVGLIVVLAIVGSFIGGDEEGADIDSTKDVAEAPVTTATVALSPTAESASPSQFAINMQIADDNWEPIPEGCVGTGPWEEMRGGTTVMVTDVSELESDAVGVIPANGLVYEDENGDLSCVSAIQIPFTEADNYYITVGGILAECDSSLVYPNDDLALISLVLADGKMTCQDLSE